MYTRRDKRERKKRKKHPHTPRACHTLLVFFFFFFPFASRERKAGSETEPSRHWPPSYSHRCFKSSSVCACLPPCLRRAKHCFVSRAVFWFFVLEPCCPRPRHCFFFHQRRDCLSVLHEQLHQKYNLTAQFTLRVFLSFLCPIRARKGLQRSFHPCVSVLCPFMVGCECRRGMLESAHEWFAGEGVLESW